MHMSYREDKNISGVKILSRKSGHVTGFTTIRKCSSAMTSWRCTWMERRCKRKLRQMKCDVPTSRETQHLQAQEFRRQQGQTCGLQAIRHIWHTCEPRPVQLQTLSKLQVESSTSVCNNCCKNNNKKDTNSSIITSSNNKIENSDCGISSVPTIGLALKAQCDVHCVCCCCRLYNGDAGINFSSWFVLALPNMFLALLTL